MQQQERKGSRGSAVKTFPHQQHSLEYNSLERTNVCRKQERERFSTWCIT